MEKVHEVEDCLELLAEVAPTEEGGVWLTDNEKCAEVERVLPTLQGLLVGMKDTLQMELTMNQVASKENWGVVKLLEEDVGFSFLTILCLYIFLLSLVNSTSFFHFLIS